MRHSLLIPFIFSIVCVNNSLGQQADLDSLKREILALKTEMRNLELDMATGEKKFKRGILVATIGYSVTIAGGLMLGRKYDDVGKVLLVTGGTTGIIGTAMMLDSFKYLGNPYRRNQHKQNSKKSLAK
ncbi:MAG TPA: hypothetical protein VE467_01330 [Chryseolinea sp.]|nr:hypothetical protein [Chryseolinea sp.]